MSMGMGINPANGLTGTGMGTSVPDYLLPHPPTAPREKHPGYVAGELLKLAAQAARQTAASLAGRGSRLFGASDCSNNIVADNPGMSDAGISAVETLCTNTDTELNVQNVNLNKADINAIFAALKQNTAISTLTFSGVYCDTVFFMGKLVANMPGSVNHLTLDIFETEASNINPSPIKYEAAELLFRKLGCTGLISLTLGAVRFTVQAAEALATTFQNNPFFPLKNFFFTWHSSQLTDALFSVISKALEAAQCLKTVGVGNFAGLTRNMTTTFFGSIAKTNISNAYLWCPEPTNFNSIEDQTILTAAEAAPCFSSYIETANRCFFSPLATMLLNITQSKTPCISDPRCDVPRNCSAEFVPSPSSSASITQTSYFPVVTAIGGFAILLATLFFTYKKRHHCKREAAPEQDLKEVTVRKTKDIALDSLHTKKTTQQDLPPPAPAVEERAEGQGEL